MRVIKSIYTIRLVLLLIYSKYNVQFNFRQLRKIHKQSKLYNDITIHSIELFNIHPDLKIIYFHFYIYYSTNVEQFIVVIEISNGI